MKKLTASILVLALLLTLCPVAFAAEAPLQVDRTYHVNPLYDHILTEADLHRPRTRDAVAAEEPVYLDDTAEGGAVLREAMKQRQEVCQVHIRTADYSEERLDQIMYEISDAAMVHTGVPTEGDYLIWQYGGWSAGAEGMVKNGYAYLTYTYELTYYTTAQEEAQVDRRVDQLLDQLALSGEDDYQDLSAIYDYICDNVVYDYDHVNDISYLHQFTAYAALIEGTAVCQGYAVLLYRLALEAGIDCRVIIGTGSGGAHGWNIARLGDYYYDLDATWDAGASQYAYFLRCEANFDDHIRDPEYDTPQFHADYPMSPTDYAPVTHDYRAQTTAPTCTAGGYTTYTCANCGDSYTADHTAALGHSYGRWTQSVAPGCTSEGQQRRTCGRCDAYETKSIAPLGHDYEDGACKRCDALQPGHVTAPGAPSIVSCFSRLQTSVKVTWTLVDGADGYELWRSTTPNEPNSWIRAKSILSGDIDRYTNQGLTEGVTYYYKVRAFVLDENGERICSDFSAVDHMPAAVVFDSPYSNSTFRIRLRWYEINGAHGYQIWRKNGDGTFSVAKTIGDRGNQLTNDQGATTAYSNVGLIAGEDYTYKLRAFYITADGRKIFGAYSDEVTIAVMPETPEITVTSPKAGRVSLTWDALYGTEGFQVWMSTSPDRGFAIGKSVTDGTATGATIYGLESGKTYYFKVRAYVEVDGKKTFGAYSDTIAITIN